MICKSLASFSEEHPFRKSHVVQASLPRFRAARALDTPAAPPSNAYVYVLRTYPPVQSRNLASSSPK